MSEAVLVAVILAIGPILVAIIGLQVQAKHAQAEVKQEQADSKEKIQQVHLLVNDRLDKVLKANQLLFEANKELLGTVKDLEAHIHADSAMDLSAAEERAIGRAGQVPPLSQTLQSTKIQDPAEDLSQIDGLPTPSPPEEP